MTEIKITETGPDLQRYATQAVINPENAFSPGFIEEFHQVSRFPRGTINIDVSSLCNLSCHMCPLWGDVKKGHIKHQLMDYDLFVHIMDQLDRYAPAAGVSLTARGELFCHPRAMDIIREIKKRRKRLVFVTNGTLFGRDEIKEMVDLAVDDIRISNDALTRQTYYKIRGKDRFFKVVDNIHEILSRTGGLGGMFKTRLILNFVYQDDNAHELLPFVLYWGPLVNEIHSFKWNTTIDSPYSAVNINRNFQVPGRYMCLAPWRDVYIDSSGLVYPCCADPFVSMKLGNIAEQPLEEIWHGERYNQLRLAILRNDLGEFKQCARCNNWIMNFRKYTIVLGTKAFFEQEYHGMTKFTFIREYPEEEFSAEKYLNDVSSTVLKIDRQIQRQRQRQKNQG